MKTRFLLSPLVYLLAVILFSGCSRSPLIGSWTTDDSETITFSKSTFTQTIESAKNEPAATIFGKYSIYISKDNSKNLIDLAMVSDSRTPGSIYSGGFHTIYEYSFSKEELIIKDGNSEIKKYHRLKTDR